MKSVKMRFQHAANYRLYGKEIKSTAKLWVLHIFASNLQNKLILIKGRTFSVLSQIYFLPFPLKAQWLLTASLKWYA